MLRNLRQTNRVRQSANRPKLDKSKSVNEAVYGQNPNQDRQIAKA